MSDTGDRSSRRSSRASRSHSPGPPTPPIPMARSRAASTSPADPGPFPDRAIVVGHPPDSPSPLAIRASNSPSSRIRQPQLELGRELLFKPLVDLRQVEYVSPVDDNLVCLICHCPFVEPRLIVACDHVFCADCLNQALAAQRHTQKTCPTCRTPIESAERSDKVQRMITTMLDELVIKCPNTYLGCDWSDKRVYVQDHVELYCGFTMVACPDKTCRSQILQKDSHRGCLHSTVNCSDCHTSMMKKDLQDHLKNHCENRMTTCRECGEDLVRVEVPEHLSKSCLKAIIACPGEFLGCTFKDERATALKHVPDCPMATMAPHFAAQNAKIESQDKAQKLLSRKLEALEGSLQTMLTPNNLSTQLSADAHEFPAGPSYVNDLNGAPFDSTTHHVLSVHETLRGEVDRCTSALAELDGRLTMTLLNEQGHTRDELLHLNHAIGAMRMQLQWLVSARLQAQGRVTGNQVSAASGHSNSTNASTSSSNAGPSSGFTLQPIRRMSDPNRQDPKL